MRTAQEILDAKNLHWTYLANGNGRELHDIDCKFCPVEDDVLDAMQEYLDQYKAELLAKLDEEMLLIDNDGSADQIEHIKTLIK